MSQAAAYDYIIVGAGSAGCVLAHRLSALDTLRVLLIEAGGSDSHPMIHMPAGIALLTGNRRVNWRYRQGARRQQLDQRHVLHARPSP